MPFVSFSVVSCFAHSLDGPIGSPCCYSPVVAKWVLECPALQFMQKLWLGAPMVVLKVPLGHSVHSIAPDELNEHKSWHDLYSRVAVERSDCRDPKTLARSERF